MKHFYVLFTIFVVLLLSTVGCAIRNTPNEQQQEQVHSQRNNNSTTNITGHVGAVADGIVEGEVSPVPEAESITRIESEPIVMAEDIPVKSEAIAVPNDIYTIESNSVTNNAQSNTNVQENKINTTMPANESGSKEAINEEVTNNDKQTANPEQPKPNVKSEPKQAKAKSNAKSNPKQAKASTKETSKQPSNSKKKSLANAKTEILASFTTNFNVENKPRVSNIKLASKKINGTLLYPGETFSFNGTVGPTGKSNGFELATVIVAGKESKGYGGGVCQVSSTLFNAAEKSGMKIVERHPHSRPVPYVAKGRDAATSTGGIDFKFRNTKDYPVKVFASVEGGAVTVSVSKVIV